jgi:hypothetical protein
MTILTRQSHPTRSSSHSGAEQVLYFSTTNAQVLQYFSTTN